MNGTRVSVGDYLIQKIKESGVRHVFGVPGDYILNFYARMEKSPLSVINTCDEQGAGFAADAYGRKHGLGVVCVTYNVGGLKVINPAGGAYAENSPLLVIAGAPGRQERQKCPFLHHKIREYDDQLAIFRHITVASTDLADPDTALQEIDRVISAVIEAKKTGYIEIPRDMVDIIPEREHPVKRNQKPLPPPISHDSTMEALVSAINTAEKPALMAGSGIIRHKLSLYLKILSDKTNIPIVTTIRGKSAVDERNPHFLGVYAGIIGDDDIRRYIEASDCVIQLGVLPTDVDMGANTAVLNPDSIIVLSEESCLIGRRTFPHPGLMLLSDLSQQKLTVHHTEDLPAPVREKIPAFSPTNALITTEKLVQALNSFLDENTILITEVGDAVMMSLDCTIKRVGGYLSPAYYSSLGYSVPAAIGIQAADPEIRPLVLTGDGAFQMTGMEISTAARYGMNPIVIVINNCGFGTERPMIDGAFNDVAPWKYHRIPDMIGCGKGYLVTTEIELSDALTEAYASDEYSIIEVRTDPFDISPQLRRLCQRFKQGVKQE